MNHHQLPLSLKLFEALGEDYVFIELEPLPDVRKKLGYADMKDYYPFILSAYSSDEAHAYADQVVMECDVLLAGSCPDNYIMKRLNIGKIVIKVCERYFKEKRGFLDEVRNYIRAMKHLSPFQNKKCYFLCASGYADQDINRYTNFKGKAYKWGYFPETLVYDTERLMRQKRENDKLMILWVGRLIGWKHPEVAIKIAKRLRDAGYSFELEIIGIGELESELHSYIEQLEMGETIKLLGSMKPEEVRHHMEKANIYLFTSDQNEGWGAVLNESMNSGCAIIADRRIGAVPFMLKHNENGLVYDSEDDLFQYVKQLMDNRDICEQLGKMAYYTVADLWNADTAAYRLLCLINSIKTQGFCDLFLDGICSPTSERSSMKFQ